MSYFCNAKKKPKKIIVFSRDELKQYEMGKLLDKKKFSNIRYFLGDVRDKDRLRLAIKDVDIVLNSDKNIEFLRILKLRGDSVIKEFQEFLIKNKLSSHVWVLAKK